MAVVGLALALGASASRAAIVQTIIDTDSAAAVGSITFPTLTGDSDAGVLFSYDGFTQADLTSISWTLDPASDNVVALNLNAFQGDKPCPNGGDCSNISLNLSPTSASTSEAACEGFSCGYLPGNANVEFVPAAPVPEPSTWVMMVVGFAGLGFAGYRSNRQAAQAN